MPPHSTRIRKYRARSKTANLARCMDGSRRISIGMGENIDRTRSSSGLRVGSACNPILLISEKSTASSIVKVSLHGRPLGCNNAVHASIAKCAVVCDLMAAQYTVQFCAQPLYAMTTLVVEKMSPKLNRDALQCVKGMLEKQKLALCVDWRPLDAFPIPRSANLQAAMVRLDI